MIWSQGITRRSFVSLAGAAALRADTPQERARQIVDKTVYALGGDGFRQMQTRVERGRAYSFYREKISGLSFSRIYTRYLPPQEGEAIRMVQRQAFGKKDKEDAAILITTQEMWDVSFRGAKQLPETRMKQFRDTNLHDIFYILRMRLEEPGLIFEHKGRDVVENQPVEVIDCVDTENRTVTVWIHSSTLLPVRQSFKRWDPVVADRREEVTRYTKYRESGNGVMWPHDVQRERDGEKTYEMYSDKVVVGEELKSGLFELPPGIAILKK